MFDRVLNTPMPLTSLTSIICGIEKKLWKNLNPVLHPVEIRHECLGTNECRNQREKLFCEYAALHLCRYSPDQIQQKTLKVYGYCSCSKVSGKLWTCFWQQRCIYLEGIHNDFFFDSCEPISESACQIKGAVKTAFNLLKFNAQKLVKIFTN